MIIVVGGQARKAGKTTAVCDIITATPEARWVAYKISPHEHGAPAAGSLPDSQRYLAAGAAEGHLVKAMPPLPEGRNVIIESNSVLETLDPDLVVFVADAANPDYKPSAALAQARASFVIGGRPTAQLIAAVRARLSGQAPVIEAAQ